jgi:CubicO group peptidase (beta-lactamase class C family)
MSRHDGPRIACALLVFSHIAMSPSLLAKHSMQAGRINSILDSAGLGSGNVPGAATTVIKDGHIVFQRSYGVRDLHSLEKIDEHTNFRLASVTKQFTAMAIMLLVHDGKLQYNERLTDIFPDFPEYGRTITVRMLLNHTSGLQDYEDLMPHSAPQVPREQNQIEDTGVLDLLKRQNSTKFPPGSRWKYSNSGYVLLGVIVHKVSGISFPDFLHERIFSPMGMNNTVAYVCGQNQVPNRAFGHSFENGTWKQTDQSPTSATLGDGGIYSSVEELAKWDRALRDHTLLSRAEMKQALTPVSVPESRNPTVCPLSTGLVGF